MVGKSHRRDVLWKRRLPALFKTGPFTLEEAREAGLERWHLEGAKWKRIAPRTYAAAEVPDSPITNLLAARHRLPAVAAFSGRTAAWMHGLDLPPCDPIEVTIPKGSGISARAGLVVRRAQLAGGDVVLLHGMRVTSALRTIFDLASRQSLIEAVVTIDLALHAELLGIQELSSYMALRTGSRGAKTVRRALALADAASESAMESRLRLLIVVGGLPRPEVQTTITDSDDRVLARLDLFYPDALLGIEYDGSTHRDSLIEDDRRQNRLLGAGIRLLRFTASDVYQTPQATLAQIRSELQMAASAGSRGVLRTKKPVSAGTRVGRAAR